MKEIIKNTVGIEGFPFLFFVLILDELQNIVLLQGSEKVNISRDIAEQMRFLLKIL